MKLNQFTALSSACLLSGTKAGWFSSESSDSETKAGDWNDDWNGDLNSDFHGDINGDLNGDLNAVLYGDLKGDLNGDLNGRSGCPFEM